MPGSFHNDSIFWLLLLMVLGFAWLNMRLDKPDGRWMRPVQRKRPVYGSPEHKSSVPELTKYMNKLTNTSFTWYQRKKHRKRWEKAAAGPATEPAAKFMKYITGYPKHVEYYIEFEDEWPTHCPSHKDFFSQRPVTKEGVDAFFRANLMWLVHADIEGRPGDTETKNRWLRVAISRCGKRLKALNLPHWTILDLDSLLADHHELACTRLRMAASKRETDEQGSSEVDPLGFAIHNYKSSFDEAVKILLNRGASATPEHLEHIRKERKDELSRPRRAQTAKQDEYLARLVRYERDIENAIKEQEATKAVLPTIHHTTLC